MRYTVLFVLFAATAVLAQPSEDAVKKELKLFQGKWQAIAARSADGEPIPAEKVKRMSEVIEGDKFTMKTGDETSLEGKFKIDPTKKIKTIDVIVGDITLLGIYQTDGDTRTSCFAVAGKERPDGFRKEKGFLYLEWKRAK